MNTSKLKRMADIVKDILEKDNLAKTDDCYLTLKVLEITHPKEVGKAFTEVMLNAKKNKINFESIRRCRQKVQEKYPHLKNITTAEKRTEEISKYRKFALEK